jgi:Ankyrin repeats (3 copies)
VSSSVSLTNAVTSGDERAVNALIAKGADVNQSTSGGQTALILAVIFGHTHLVKLLVNSGADPQLRDNLGLNALEWAKRRGSAEALEILSNPPRPTPKREVKEPERPVVKAPPAQPEPETKDTISEDEKSRRWLTGLRQRLNEQEARRNVSRPEPAPQAKIEPPKVQPPPVLPPPAQTTKSSEQAKPKPASPSQPVKGRVIEPPAETPAATGKRKRCPRCNAIYNGDLVSYCAHHIVPLVDADEPIISTPPKPNPPLFWIMVVITLTGSIVVGSLITTYFYKSNQAAARSAASQGTNIQKGFPELGGELVGKAVSLPEAECPLNGPEPLTGTVTVRVMVDKNGQVYWARGSGGDWLMRGASTEAAMKSTFSPEKLRGRETEGTITYTFK